MSKATKILIVDDDASMVFMLKELLEEHGHATVLAANGREGLERLDYADAVLTDLQMPGMSGLELIHAIHEEDATLPVVVLTAHGSEKDAVRAMKAGAYDYLTKPFDIDEVTLTVDRALETRALRLANRRLVSERSV